MVTGMELILFFLEFGPAAYKLVSKLIPKKGRNDVKIKLNTIKSIIGVMQPFTEAMKQIQVKRAGTAGVPEELKQLFQTVKKGNELVRRRENRQKELEEWIDSFWVSLCIAVSKVLVGMAQNLEEIKQQLLLNQSPQIHIHQHFSEEKLQKFIDCVNMPRGSKPLTQGLESESVRNDKSKTNEAKQQKESVPQASKVVPSNQIPESVDEDNIPTDKINNSEPVLKKVVFEVLARDDYAEKIVKKAVCNVKGVIYAERVVRDNQETDLVTVTASEIFVEKEMIKYLEKKLQRENVYVKAGTNPKLV